MPSKDKSFLSFIKRIQLLLVARDYNCSLETHQQKFLQNILPSSITQTFQIFEDYQQNHNLDVLLTHTVFITV